MEPLEIILKELKINVFKIRDDEMATFCLNPEHEDKHLGNFYINLKSGKFHCFACGFAGNIISLLFDRGVTYSVALRYWQSFQLDWKAELEISEPVDRYVVESYKRNPVSEYALNRVKDKNILEKYGVFADTAGNPIFSTRTGLGYTSLWVREHGNYLLIEPLNAKRQGVIFGSHLPPTDFTVLCEGPFDAMAVNRELGEKAICGFGTFFTKQQLRVLRRTSNLVVMMDGDTAGRRARHRICEQLKNKSDMYVCGGYLVDPDELDGDKIRKVFDAKKLALEYRLNYAK